MRVIEFLVSIGFIVTGNLATTLHMVATNRREKRGRERMTKPLLRRLETSMSGSYDECTLQEY